MELMEEILVPQTRILAAEPDLDEDIGELQVAEYLVLLLAFDVYVRYVEEVTHVDANDLHTRKGLRLLRLADSTQGEAIRDFLQENVSRDESKRSILRSFRVRVSDPQQASRRALTLRTALNRGGPVVLKTVFKVPRACKEVKVAITASMQEESVAALAKIAALSLQNTRIKGWVRESAKIAADGVVPEIEGSTVQVVQETTPVPPVPQNPVELATEAAAHTVTELRTQRLKEEGTTHAAEAKDEQSAQQSTLNNVQLKATESARQALQDAGETDQPPTKSETIGIATAVALSIVSDASNPNSVPEALKRLDPEQRSAALTDGRVLVAAGAGGGKSTTLVCRVKYLVEERGVPPTKILVSSFNKKAAEELKTKIGKAVGGDLTNAMTVGTLHGLFLGAIKKYGTPEEKAMFEGKLNILSGSAIASAVNKIWRKCFATVMPNGSLKDADPPKAKQMRMAVTKWAGNGVSVAQAKATARGKNERDAAVWYEMYEGLKGAIPGWKPNCEGRAEARSEWDRFNKKNREHRGQNGQTYLRRIGDFDDMIAVFKNLLERNLDVRQKAQKAFDHILIDECQDLNSQQHRVLELMTEHITDGKDGKSFWMIGDDKQSIYHFRGARPDLFTGLDGKEGWTTRMIRTNYRCPPEVVDAANKLVAHNEGQIPMEANPAPSRARGEASITVRGYGDEAETAIAVAGEIKGTWDSGLGAISDNAILCRTNNELNSYETALLMRGVPYARKGASSFLSSPETKAVLGYISLVSDTDFEKMQEALVDILNKPNRFFVAPDKVERAVSIALSNYARSEGVAKKAINPMVALRNKDFQDDLIESLTGGSVRDFKGRKALGTLGDLLDALNQLELLTKDPEASTKDMFDSVLDMPGVAFEIDQDSGRIIGQKTVTFREELNATLKDFGSEEDDVKEDEAEAQSLGNVAFLYELAKPDPNDPGDLEVSPEKPHGFWAKMGRLTEKAKELRIDTEVWEKEQDKLPPEDRKPAPGVYLGTIHSVKGAQWPNVFVQMNRGRFPLERRGDGDDEGLPLTAEQQAEQEEEARGERRLAYVALTRPSKNLRVVYSGQYQGKAAGPSIYISEAGLVNGENVGLEAIPKTSAFIEDLVN